MEWTDASLTHATEAARALLSRLGLAEYRFTVAPRAELVGVHVQYATLDAWRSTTLKVDAPQLLASQREPSVQDALLLEWGSRFDHAKYR